MFKSLCLYRSMSSCFFNVTMRGFLLPLSALICLTIIVKVDSKDESEVNGYRMHHLTFDAFPNSPPAAVMKKRNEVSGAAIEENGEVDRRHHRSDGEKRRRRGQRGRQRKNRRNKGKGRRPHRGHNRGHRNMRQRSHMSVCDPACVEGQKCYKNQCREYPPKCEPACSEGQRCTFSGCKEPPTCRRTCPDDKICTRHGCKPDPFA